MCPNPQIPAIALSISLPLETKDAILVTNVRSFFSTFVPIPLTYVSRVVRTNETVFEKAKLAGNRVNVGARPCMGYTMGLLPGLVVSRLVVHLITMIQGHENYTTLSLTS